MAEVGEMVGIWILNVSEVDTVANVGVVRGRVRNCDRVWRRIWILRVSGMDTDQTWCADDTTCTSEDEDAMNRLLHAIDTE